MTESSEKTGERKPPEIRREVDRPPRHAESERAIPDELAKKLELLVNAQKAQHHMALVNKSFWLIVGVGLAWLAMGVVDTVLLENGLSGNELVKELIGVFKFLVPSLVGFVFGTKTKGE